MHVSLGFAPYLAIVFTTISAVAQQPVTTPKKVRGTVTALSVDEGSS